MWSAFASQYIIICSPTAFANDHDSDYFLKSEKKKEKNFIQIIKYSEML